MNQKLRKQLKRIVPVTLAVIVLAGFIFGAVGMMVAYADEPDPEVGNIGWIKESNVSVNFTLSNAKDTNEKESDLYFNKRYTAEVQIQLEGTGAEEYNSKNKPDNFMKVYMESGYIGNEEKGDFATSSRTEGRSSFVKSEVKDQNDGTYLFTFKLENVWPYYRIKNGEDPIMSFYILYPDQNAYDSFSKSCVGITFAGENYKSKSIGKINVDPDDTIPDDNENTSTSRPGVNDDDTEASIPTPKMIISSFDIPSEVVYGEEFDATIEFYNNSAYKDMVNVTMTVTPSEGVSIRNGVNQRHYIKIPKRQSTTERFRFKASDKLAAEAITLTVKFEYEYRFNKEYKQGSHEEVLSLMAKPKPEESSSSDSDKDGTEGSISSFELLSIVVPDKVYPDEDAYITIRAINKDHQFDASNVQVTVTGDGLLNSGNTVYHGALAHSTQAEIETTLQFASPGTYPLVCTLVYEDSVGLDEDKKPIVRINDIQKEFTVTVLESPYADMGNMGGMGDMGDMGIMDGMDGMDAVPAQGGVVEWMRGHLWAPIGGGVVLLAVIAGVVRHIRRKKAADDDDL